MEVENVEYLDARSKIDDAETKSKRNKDWDYDTFEKACTSLVAENPPVIQTKVQ